MDLDKLVKKQILGLNPYKSGKPIDEVKREFNIKKIIKLASNENPIGPSKKAIEAIRDTSTKVNRYPDASCYELKKELASKFSGLTADNFVIGNGSNEIIELALRTFLNPGEDVISCEPTFLIYNLATLVEGGNYIAAKLDENFKYDLTAISNKITDNTKIVFISNPNNPTGTYISERKIKQFLDNLPEHVVVVLDEAYNEFIEENDSTSWSNYISSKPLIIARTFSKAYGLSGLRIGYGIANEKCIDYLNRTRQPFNVNMIAQYAAVAALKDDEHLYNTKKLISEQKNYLYRELEKMGLEFVKSYTNFILVNVNRDSYELYEEMLKYGVIVRSMKAYKLDKYIRITVGLPEENKKLIEVLTKILDL